MDNKERIRVLQARRNSIKGSLASFQTFLSNYTSKDYVQLNMRFQKINSQFQNFDDFHDELDAMDDSEKSVSERFVILESYYQAMSKAQEYLSDDSNDIKFEQKVFPIKIEPPSSPTHSSTTVFSGLEVLQSNHHNKYALISREISWFLNMPKEADNDYETIENFVNELQRHVQSLSDLGVTVPQEFIIVLVQERFLNSVNREKWENSILLQDDFPTLDHLFKFLSKVAFMSRQHEAEKQQSEEASPASPKLSVSSEVSRSPEKKASTRHEEKTSPLEKKASTRHEEKTSSPEKKSSTRHEEKTSSPEKKAPTRHEEKTSPKKTSPVNAIRTKITDRLSSRRSKICFACTEGCYHLSRCETFLDLSVRQRMNFINYHRICKVCLNKHASQCVSTHLCKICGRKHSTLVHVP